MKQITTILALLIAGVAWSSTALAEIRIATIQSQRLIKESPQYKKMEAQMKADFERRAKELEQQGKQLSEDLQAFKAIQEGYGYGAAEIDVVDGPAGNLQQNLVFVHLRPLHSFNLQTIL